MGLPISVLLRGRDDRAVVVGLRAFFAELRRVDAVFSTYREDSEISRLRRGALAVDAVSDEVADVLALCRQARQITDGLFDADATAGGIDPSGLVKGWAVERAARHLDLDEVDYCINAGGDVLTRVLPGRSPWRIGLESPHDRWAVVDVVTVAGGALATSGTAARGAHIVDPRTGGAADAVASVSVRGPSLLTADVLATAGFVYGTGAEKWVAQRDGYTALVVERDGSMCRGPGWPAA
ncbi:MAG: FAD:protein transferase [Actinomycetota bacterium]|nr:FAD:protein transferase [Actinomycetota bacterium]